MKKRCEKCNEEFTPETSFKKYCSSTCRSRDRFIEIEKDGEKYKVWKVNFEKYKEFYIDPFLCKKGKLNKCFVCESVFKGYRLCCSNECTNKMKANTLIKTVGSTHNLSRNSASRIEMEDRLFEKYGVRNVFSIEEVKKKLKETWRVDNPSQKIETKIKVRKTNVEKGNWLPADEKKAWDLYKGNVKFVTGLSINRFAFSQWDKNFVQRWSYDQYHVDHIYSIYDGFVNNVSPLIVGSFCNLRLIWWEENFSKGKKSDMCLNTLLEKYNEFCLNYSEKTEGIRVRYEGLIKQQNLQNENKID